MIRSLITLVALTALTGCRGPWDARGEADRESGKTAVVMDDYAEDNVSVTGHKVEALPDGRRVVSALLYNRRDETLSLQAQVAFKRADGFPSGDESNWELILIGPYETYALRVPSLGTDAATHTLRLRRPAFGG